jgi:putative multicomponent Na+:H+ antiporter subunit B
MNASLSLGGELDLLLPITALLPVTALLLVSQSNPYQTLVLRGILGSVATLLYALLGAPDVALTEALVGTLLSTTLYAVALRSSMALRLEDRRSRPDPSRDAQLSAWIAHLHLRLRWQGNDEPGRNGSHGWLNDNGQLVLLQQPLRRQLEQCPGYAAWRASGGELHLASEPQP